MYYICIMAVLYSYIVNVLRLYYRNSRSENVPWNTPVLKDSNSHIANVKGVQPSGHESMLETRLRQNIVLNYCDHFRCICKRGFVLCLFMRI